MGRDPADEDLVVSCQNLGADLNSGGGEALSRADAIRLDLINAPGGVREDGVPPPASLSLARDAEGLAEGVYLRVEDLLVRAQVEAASGPLVGGPSYTCRSYLATIQTGAVGPDCIPSHPCAYCLESALPALYNRLARVKPASPPLLGLCCIAWAEGGRSSEAPRKGQPLSAQDFLWSFAILGSGM